MSISQFVIKYNKQKRGIAMRIKDLREDSDITQQTIADYLNIKQNTYSQYENGQRQLPIDILIKIAEYYDVSTDYLLGLTNEKNPYPKIKSIWNLENVQNILNSFPKGFYKE